jgi:hypothetical protein
MSHPLVGAECNQVHGRVKITHLSGPFRPHRTELEAACNSPG